MNARIAAVIVAAGQSTRFGAPKILTPIAGIPVILRSVRAIQSVPGWSQIVLVINSDLRPQVEAILASDQSPAAVMLVSGGERRQDSVLAGVDAIDDAGIVVIHDGARPLVTSQLIHATIAAVQAGADAAVAAVPVADTLKRDIAGRVETVDRANLWRAQTPQAFRVDRLREALANADQHDLTVTDEAAAIELMGGKVVLVPGDEQNIKLTTPGDARVIEALAGANSESGRVMMRTGIGYDVHRLVSGRPLVLGGIEIPFELGLEGHSDADVLLHAIADAILGAAAMGDIGRHFPPSDDTYRDISSVTLLERCREIVSGAGYEVANVDATVIAEEPKIGPHADQMRAVIATALGIDLGAVSLKATTNERLGFAGRREGIAAMAVATIRGSAEAMRVLLQRVSSASVCVDGEVVGEIGRGLVALVGIGHSDSPNVVERMASKCVKLRIFEDAAGKMNRSLRDLTAEPDGAGMLVVSQFTLYADVRKGRRPSFIDAAPPNLGQELVDAFSAAMQSHGIAVATGQFGAHMVVSLENDGPVTIWLDSAELARS